MEVTCLFPSPRFDFSSNTRYAHVEGPARNEQSANNELRPLFLRPLVQHYYDGNGGLRGYEQNDAARKAFASDRSNMSVESSGTNRSAGGKLTQYSKEKKKEYGF